MAAVGARVLRFARQRIWKGGSAKLLRYRRHALTMTKAGGGNLPGSLDSFKPYRPNGCLCDFHGLPTLRGILLPAVPVWQTRYVVRFCTQENKNGAERQSKPSQVSWSFRAVLHRRSFNFLFAAKGKNRLPQVFQSFVVILRKPKGYTTPLSALYCSSLK